MKNLLLLILMLSALSTKSQTSVYHPFPDSNAVWNINFTSDCSFGSAIEDYSIALSGDTSIKSQIYHKLTIPYVQFYSTGTCTQYHTASYRGAIRQDIANKKVFYVPPAYETEQLLYDFTMQVGDTVKGFIGSYANPKDTVVSMDSVLINNNYRKRWNINPCYGIYFIEGIGSTYGLIEMSLGCITDQAGYSITCFNQDGHSLYPDTTTNCQLITSVNPADAILKQVKIFPNPSNGSFTIDIGQYQDIREIQVSNLLGNIVSRRQITNQKRINIDYLQSGTYIMTIIDKGNRKISRKIISCP